MQVSQIEYAITLYNKGYLKGPITCQCGCKLFKIYYDSYYKVNQCSFRCSNYKCRRRYSITINSFFNNFTYQNIQLISEIIKCFITRDMNATKAYKFINSELKVLASKQLIRRVYKDIRKVICKSLKIEYQSTLLGNENEWKYYSADESLINHYNGKQIWLLGICDNNTKEFRIEASYDRDAETLKEFITSFVKKGNNIITDGWAGYSFLDEPGSGYRRIPHIHGGGDFGYGLQSTSHIESIWSQIKSKLKETYHIYPHGIFMTFVREIEFKIKANAMTDEQKIKNFFDCYDLSENVEDAALLNDTRIFLDEVVNESEDSSEEDN